jgi:hypothetical protein
MSILEKYIPQIGASKAAVLEIRDVQVEQALPANEDLARKVQF